MFLSSSPDLGGRQLQDPRAGEVSGGVEGHHWEYNLFLVQSTVHTVFTKMLSSYMGRIKLLHHGAPMRRPNISTPPPTTNQVWRRGSLISLDWPGTLTQTIASSWPRLLSIFVQTKDMNRNPATIFSKLDIIACNIRIFVFETKDMYGSGNVSTTQHSTEITPKTSNNMRSSATNSE